MRQNTDNKIRKWPVHGPSRIFSSFFSYFRGATRGGEFQESPISSCILWTWGSRNHNTKLVNQRKKPYVSWASSRTHKHIDQDTVYVNVPRPFSVPETSFHQIKPRVRKSAAEKRGLWEGVVQEPLRRALFCVFLCVLRWFSPANLTEISFRYCPSNAGIFWKTPSRKTPKRSCWVKFIARDSGAGMAAPILWAPGMFAFFLQENPSGPKKFLVWGRRDLGFWGGECQFYFLARA